jgi:hypothetical protein
LKSQSKQLALVAMVEDRPLGKHFPFWPFIPYRGKTWSTCIARTSIMAAPSSPPWFRFEKHFPRSIYENCFEEGQHEKIYTRVLMREPFESSCEANGRAPLPPPCRFSDLAGPPCIPITRSTSHPPPLHLGKPSSSARSGPASAKPVRICRTHQFGH